MPQQQQQHQPLQSILRYATRQATQGSLVGLHPSPSLPAMPSYPPLSRLKRRQRRCQLRHVGNAPRILLEPLLLPPLPPHRRKRQKLCALQKVLAARSLKPSIAKRLQHTARQREAARRVTCFKLVLFELNFVLFHFALLLLRCVWPFCFN